MPSQKSRKLPLRIKKSQQFGHNRNNKHGLCKQVSTTRAIVLEARVSTDQISITGRIPISRDQTPP
jgi:hypothetical protein